MDDKIQHKMEVDYSVSVDNLLVTVKSLLAVRFKPDDDSLLAVNRNEDAYLKKYRLAILSLLSNSVFLSKNKQEQYVLICFTPE